MFFRRASKRYLNSLFTKAQDGNRQAFGKLYDLLVDEIYRYIYLKCRDKHVSEDVAGETFAKILQKLPDIQPENIRAYIYMTAKNTYIDLVRKQRYTVHDTDGHLLENNCVQHDVNHEQVFEIEHIMRTLQTLPENYIEVITLAVIEGYSLKETAEICNRSYGSTRVLLHRALKELREKV